MDSLKDNIDKYGWQFQFVFDENGMKHDFAYSIGFEESFNHPEVMIFGLNRQTMHALMSEVAAQIKQGEVFTEDIKNESVLAGNFQVCFKRVKREYHKKYVGVATKYYNKDIRVLVMLWPDQNNVLPTEADCTVSEQNEALKII